MSRMLGIYGDVAEPALKDPPAPARAASGLPSEPEPLFARLRDGDVLLHHPYESFGHVLDFVEAAASDPKVLAIKQTLYRTSADSPIVRALIRAAEGGKQVVVVVEIKARFDEAANIAWAKRLEESGVHVVYGLVGLKTHAKLTLVVRREGDRIRRYCHLGTGNYNPSTARIYTDLGLLTAREVLTADVARVFDFLTSLSRPPKMERMLVAPFDMLPRLVALVRREAEHAKAGRPARIVAKMNALADEAVIEALYEASGAGVSIDLIVRGICLLRPGIPGISETIRVDEHRRALPRAQPDLLVRERRRARGLHRQRRLDAAQPAPPRRGALPDRGRRAARPPAVGDPRDVPRRPREGPAHPPRREPRAAPAPAGRARRQRAGRAPRARGEVGQALRDAGRAASLARGSLAGPAAPSPQARRVAAHVDVASPASLRHLRRLRFCEEIAFARLPGSRRPGIPLGARPLRVRASRP